jgi:hypothetical protein
MSQKYPTKLSVSSGVAIFLFLRIVEKGSGATNPRVQFAQWGIKRQEGDVHHCSTPSAVGLRTIIPHPKQDFKAWRYAEGLFKFQLMEHKH